MKRAGLVLALALVAAAVAAAGYVVTAGRAPSAKYRTAKLDRGPIVSTVSATGTLNAVTTVQVGSQVSGQIKELLVDFNSPVRKDQLIARLDPEILLAKVNAARADLEATQAAVLNQRANVEKVRADVENVRAAVVTAEAQVERMRAEVENARATIASAHAAVARESATVANARRELERRVDLLRREIVSQSEKDQAQTAFDTAQAQLEAARAQQRAGQAGLRSAQAQLAATESQLRAAQAQLVSAQAALRVADAQLQSAEATVRQKQASLDQARVDLQHTEIRAPVDGVVVSRTVDVGQTVAASLQAPTLFTIAQDLTRMQVESAVDEADIGRLRQGMSGTFTVDAFPGETFRGRIVQIRKAPQVVQNVVTYTTVIAVSNPDGTLMPGMTANVRIQVDRRDDVLRVPNAALRYRPPGEGGAPTGSAPASGSDGAERGGGSLREVRERLTKELVLTSAQQERLDAILGEARQAFLAMRAQGLDDRARQAQRKRIRAETREKIREVLTPPQQAKYDALVAAQEGGGRGAPAGSPARVFVLGGDGKPKAVPIFIGASDGSFSEVLQGEVAPGQDVVVGQATGAPARPGGGPRMRF